MIITVDLGCKSKFTAKSNSRSATGPADEVAAEAPPEEKKLAPKTPEVVEVKIADADRSNSFFFI